MTWPPGDNGPQPGNTALGPGGDDFSTGFVTSGTPEVRATLAEWVDYLLSISPGGGTIDANLIYAGPASGAAAAADFRAMVADDLPAVINGVTVDGVLVVNDAGTIHGTLTLDGDGDFNSHVHVGGSLDVAAGAAITGTLDATAGLFTAGNLNVDGSGTIDGALIVGGVGMFTGSIDTAGVKIGGNSVLTQAQQGTITTYGPLTFGSGTTLNTGGTVSAAGGITTLVAGEGLTTSLTGTNGTITTTGTVSALETVNPQTGTTYAFAASDRAKLVTTSNTAAIAATIAQAGTATFPAGWFGDLENINTGLLTLTPTTSTINGKTTLVLQQHQSARVISDGANYFAMIGSPIYIAAGNAMVARSAGNARGSNSVDLQPTNSSMTAAQVASGTNSVALGGTNTASGTRSVAIGTGNTASGADNSVAIGYNNTAGTLTFSGPVAVGISNSVGGDNAGAFGFSNAAFGAAAFAVGYDNDAGNSVGGTFSAAFGYQNSVLGINSVGLGYRGDDRGNAGAIILSTANLGGSSSLRGRSQAEDYPSFINTTSGSSAVRLTTTGAAAGATNVAALGTSSTQMFDCWVTITDTSSGEYVTYYMAVPAAISKGANNASTALGTPGPVFTLGDVSGSPPTLAAAPTITADTTNGGYNLSYTPPVANSNTFYAVAHLRILNTRFN